MEFDEYTIALLVSGPTPNSEADEAVRAGVFSVLVLPWQIPAGAMSFSRTFFPRSMRDVTAR